MLFENNYLDGKAVLQLLLNNALWYFIGMTTRISSFYDNGTCCITLGCYIALKEHELRVPKWKNTLLSGVVFSANVLFFYMFGDKSELLYSVSIIMSSLSFVWVLYTAGFKFNFQSRCTRQLGHYSYEIYLTKRIVLLIRKVIG